MLPKLRRANQKIRRELVKFGGLNLRENAPEGSLISCQNLSSSLWPSLTPRHADSVLETRNSPSAIFDWGGKLCLVDGTDFVYDGTRVGSVTVGKKQFAVINTKLCIFPDKVYFDLDNQAFGSLESKVSCIANTAIFTENTVKLTPNPKMNPIWGRWGRSYDQAFVQAKTYATANWSGTAWTTTNETETSINKSLIGRYMIPGVDAFGNYEVPMNLGSVSMVENAKGVYGIITDTTYEDTGTMEIFGVDLQLYDGANNNQKLTALFAVGDAVEISGCVTQTANNKSLQIQAVTDDTLTFSKSSLTACNETAAIQIARTLPALDYVCESENRLWGVSNTDQTIYASALGDPKNFFVYAGTSTDSYAAPVGSDGVFTGICPYASTVLAWKEDCLHKVLGAYPSEYQVHTYQYPGVQAGSGNSLLIAGEVLYYKGRSGVYAYSGGSPLLISYALGDSPLFDATAGSDGQRYYISMRNAKTIWNTYCYDTIHRIWLTEDPVQVKQFTSMQGILYRLVGNQILKSDGFLAPGTWQAEFTAFRENTLQHKRYLRLLLRLEIAQAARVMVEVSADGEKYQTVWVGTSGGVATIPLLPNRCDGYCIRISGKGKCIFRSFAREFL
ncbi:MAG: hypothetical protein RR053_04680 [Evtepia sp.]